MMQASAPDRTRLWVWAQRGLIVAFLACCAIGAMTNAFVVLFIVVVLAMAAGYLIDPRRSWWGSGPMNLWADPEARRRYRRTEIRFFILAFIGMLVVAAVLAIIGP
jgi:hypothetical protein